MGALDGRVSLDDEAAEVELHGAGEAWSLAAEMAVVSLGSAEVMQNLREEAERVERRLLLWLL